MASQDDIVRRIIELYEGDEPIHRIVAQLRSEAVYWPDGTSVRRGQVRLVIGRYVRVLEDKNHRHDDDEFDNWLTEEAEGFGIGADREDGSDEAEDVDEEDEEDDTEDDEDEEDEDEDEDEDEEDDDDDDDDSSDD